MFDAIDAEMIREARGDQPGTTPAPDQPAPAPDAAGFEAITADLMRQAQIEAGHRTDPADPLAQYPVAKRLHAIAQQYREKVQAREEEDALTRRAYAEAVKFTAQLEAAKAGRR